MEKFVTYLRVSTSKQGRSGLGLEAQRQQLLHCVQADQVLAEFVEVESGRKADRPKLAEAMDLCKQTGATLIVAKLDRLARDVEFLFRVKNSGISIRACDLPDFNTLTVGIFASFAEYERERISERTKAAFASKRARGDSEWRTGRLTDEDRAKGSAKRRAQAVEAPANRMALAYLNAIDSDLSLRKKAELLNDHGFTTTTGGKWSGEAVRLLMRRKGAQGVQNSMPEKKKGPTLGS